MSVARGGLMVLLAAAFAPTAAHAYDGPWRITGAPACPDPNRLVQEWVEEDSAAPPGGLLEKHLAAPAGFAAPALMEVGAAAWWLGLSHRGGPDAAQERDPACFLLGTAAYYVVGPEDAPEVDFVKTVRGGNERSLSARLVELRWFDPADGRRHRWVDRAAAATRGWPREWPNPLHAPINALY